MRLSSLLVAFGFLAVGSASQLLAQPAIQINNIDATEGNAGSADAVLTVSLTAAATGVVTVAFATEDNGATGGAACGGSVDYVTESGTVQFNPGVTSQPVGVAVCGDVVDEANENVRVRLSNAVGATIQVQTGRVTIVDNDVAAPPQSSLSINDATAVEGNLGAQPAMTFTVTLSPPANQNVFVEFFTTATSPTAQGSFCGQAIDLMARQGTAAFAAGATTATITVPVCGDNIDEPDEVFDVILVNPTNGATIADATGHGTIKDDDIVASIADLTVTEGTGGETLAVVQVALSEPSTEIVIVPFSALQVAGQATQGPACEPGVDFIFKSIELQFFPGETSKPVAVPVCGDSSVEGDETFRVAVSGPLIQDTAVVTIRNDDFISTLTINDVTFLEGSAVSAVLTVTLSLPAPAAIQLTPSTAPHSSRIPRVAAATSGLVCGGPADFRALVTQIPIPAGASSASILVQICDDAVVEGLEGLTVTIQPVHGLTIGDGVGIIKITDND